jgi:hypothetical protein
MITGILGVTKENFGVYTILDKHPTKPKYLPRENGTEPAHKWHPYFFDQKIYVEGNTIEERFLKMVEHINARLAELERKKISTFRILLKDWSPKRCEDSSEPGKFYFEYRILVGI